MRDIDKLFLLLTIFNTNLGMSNSSKNDKQHENLKELHDHIKAINAKLDKIMEAVKNE